MGTKQHDRCLEKAHPSEPLFILMARDPFAPQSVVEWIKLSLTTQPINKLHEALDQAILMAMENHKYVGRPPITEEQAFQVADAIKSMESHEGI